MDLLSNRRTHERFPFSSRLEVRAHRVAASGRSAPAQAVDVSVGGFGFRSPLAWSVGDLIAVTLPEIESTAGVDAPSPHLHERPPAAHLEIVAVVRHVHRQGEEYVIGAERKAEHT